jgi:hypothetical protein
VGVEVVIALRVPLPRSARPPDAEVLEKPFLSEEHPMRVRRKVDE